jgi:hypothetical protein
MRFPLSIDVGQPSINDEETSQRECSVSPCLLRPSCSWNSWDELAQDVRRSQISKGIPQGLKKWISTWQDRTCSLDGSSIMRCFVPSTLGFIHFSTHPRSVWSDDPVALWDRFTTCLKPCGFLSQQNADEFRSASFGCFPAKASHNLHQSPYPGWCFTRHLLS